MTSDQHNHTQSQNNNILCNVQQSSSTMLSSTQGVTNEEHQSELPAKTRKKKKWHGNRKLQHFKRKCRARGLAEELITERIQNRTNITSERLPTDQIILERTHEKSWKRKREDQSIQKALNTSTKSLSQLSIPQAAVRKKTKHSPVETVSSRNEMRTQTSPQSYMLYKPSKYVKIPRRLLLHSLHLQLNCSLKKKKEQHFILSLLETID